jgi:hypothetical protein
VGAAQAADAAAAAEKGPAEKGAAEKGAAGDAAAGGGDEVVTVSGRGAQLFKTADGHRVQRNPDGVTIAALAQEEGGAVKVQFDPSGAVIVVFAEGAGRLQMNTDGSAICTRADGLAVEWHADGTTHQRLLGGGKVQINGSTNGGGGRQQYVTLADGTRVALTVGSAEAAAAAAEATESGSGSGYAGAGGAAAEAAAAGATGGGAGGAGGGTVVTEVDGTRLSVDPDHTTHLSREGEEGARLQLNSTGVLIETLAGGTVVQFSPDGLLITKLPDGTVTQVATESANRETMVQAPDGTIREQLADLEEAVFDFRGGVGAAKANARGSTAAEALAAAAAAAAAAAGGEEGGGAGRQGPVRFSGSVGRGEGVEGGEGGEGSGSESDGEGGRRPKAPASGKVTHAALFQQQRARKASNSGTIAESAAIVLRPFLCDLHALRRASVTVKLFSPSGIGLYSEKKVHRRQRGALTAL